MVKESEIDEDSENSEMAGIIDQPYFVNVMNFCRPDGPGIEHYRLIADANWPKYFSRYARVS